MSEDIKMADVFPTEVLTDNETVYNLKDSIWLGQPSVCNDWWFGVQNGSATPIARRKAAKYIAHAINNHDNLVKQVAELRAALSAVVAHQQVVIPSGYEFSATWQIANKALEQAK